MTILNSSARIRGSDRGDYGFARVRDIAFDAVHKLWRKRHAGGMKQSDIAIILNRDPGWVSKQLSAPGNWTLRTIGELIEAMDGELDIQAFGIDEPYAATPNFDAYSGYEGRHQTTGQPSPATSVILQNPTNTIAQTWPTSVPPISSRLRMEILK